jgi:serine/threonine protein kinase
MCFNLIEFYFLPSSDLKPQNIMITPSGFVKIIDFGLATAVRKHSPDSTTTVYPLQGCTGSLRYMAPEVALSQPYNEKSDIHSFGILLWQISTGKLPFAGFSLEKLVLEVIQGGLRPETGATRGGKRCSKSKVIIDPCIAEICERCFHSGSAMRPSASELLQSFSTILNKRSQT